MFTYFKLLLTLTTLSFSVNVFTDILFSGNPMIGPNVFKFNILFDFIVHFLENLIGFNSIVQNFAHSLLKISKV